MLRAAQAARQHAFPGARIEQLRPQLLGMLRREINFEAVFSRVPRARDQAVHAVYFPEYKIIVADGFERHGRETLQDAQRLRSLDRELRIALARVFDLRARAIVRANMLEVLILIARVDAQKIVRVGNLGCTSRSSTNVPCSVISPE